MTKNTKSYDENSSNISFAFLILIPVCSVAQDKIKNSMHWQ